MNEPRRRFDVEEEQERQEDEPHADEPGQEEPEAAGSLLDKEAEEVASGEEPELVAEPEAEAEAAAPAVEEERAGEEPHEELELPDERGRAWPDEEHAAGELDVPDAVDLLLGEPAGARRRVGVVVSRFNGEVTNSLLRRALLELEDAGVAPSLVTVMPVPGAFELPLGAMALAKTRRYSCIVALGCVVRGETPHFDFVAGEAASGLQLAALETGVPVSFGVLTVESVAQAEARIDRARDAVRSALEMADVFAQLRSAAGG